MKVKDYDFKYDMIEIVYSNLEGTKIGKLALGSVKAFKRDMGDMEVLSVRDYEDTKTTSVIVHDKRLD